MLNVLNTKILISGAVILAAAALIIGGTFAFFSDTETSEGNTFVAGAIDLKIDNESYAIDYNILEFQSPTGAFVFNQTTSWESKDLTTAEKFFNFSDLKPGDYGEDTISVEVGSNNAWLCAAARITRDNDETCTDPELGDDTTCVAPGIGEGDLDEGLNFAFWKDDGDNVLEVDEYNDGAGIFLGGTLADMGAAGEIALVDSAGGPLGPSPVPGGSTSYIGKAWCFGSFTATPLTQDAESNDGPIDDDDINGADRLGTGFTCDGTNVNNAAQTDSAVGDLQFYAVQARNNAQFTCAGNYTPTWPTITP